jgi:fructose-bisphosphate aldolase, class I
MTTGDLRSTAEALVAPGKGILAADESFPTIEKRFKSIDLPSSEDNRRAYRDMLFATPSLEEFISGVIFFDETMRQSTDDGTPFPELLAGKGIIPGIKVDAGAKDLAGFPGEKVTEGLDGLRGRLEEYVSMGARFTKWRAVIAIGDGIPTDYCIRANAHALGRMAALSQEAGLVPIVEPEVLIDGDHTIERCYEATTSTLTALFEELDAARIDLPGTLLKTNMVLSGKDAADRAGVEKVAEQTVRCMKGSVPAEIPGIVFLSGGQSDEEATAHLDAMNKLGGHPWELSFSYGRALQAPALKAWKGDASNVEAGQRALYSRPTLTGGARRGSYPPEMQNQAASEARASPPRRRCARRHSSPRPPAFARRTIALRSRSSSTSGRAPSWKEIATPSGRRSTIPTRSSGAGSSGCSGGSRGCRWRATRWRRAGTSSATWPGRPIASSTRAPKTSPCP